METNDEFQERIRREQQVAARLRLATERLEDAQRERVWAIVEAHQSRLSVRQIAAATGLSSRRAPPVGVARPPDRGRARPQLEPSPPAPRLGRGSRDPPVAQSAAQAEPP